MLAFFFFVNLKFLLLLWFFNVGERIPEFKKKLLLEVSQAQQRDSTHFRFGCGVWVILGWQRKVLSTGVGLRVIVIYGKKLSRILDEEWHNGTGFDRWVAQEEDTN